MYGMKFKILTERPVGASFPSCFFFSLSSSSFVDGHISAGGKMLRQTQIMSFVGGDHQQCQMLYQISRSNIILNRRRKNQKQCLLLLMGSSRLGKSLSVLPQRVLFFINILHHNPFSSKYGCQKIWETNQIFLS